MSAEKLMDTDGAGSEEALRRVYGESATFSYVDVFTLVHLDAPTPEVIARRTSEFDPREFFVDDCPLCRASREHGGHIVFANSDHDGSGDEDELADEPAYEGGYVATPLKAPAVELLRALDQLDVAADELVCALEPVATAELLKRTIEDLGFLHDRFVESMWAEESIARLEVFEQQLAKALMTISAVREAHESLATLVAEVMAPIEKVAGICRNL